MHSPADAIAKIDRKPALDKASVVAQNQIVNAMPKITSMRKLSMSTRGTRHQIAMAAALMTVIPLLAIAFMLRFSPPGIYSDYVKVVVGGIAGLLSLSGYLILSKYPRHLTKLRQALRAIAEGELPDKVALLNSEDDINAIERYLNALVDDLKTKVKMLEKQLRITNEMKNKLEHQQQELLDAERHRVMIQSLGAACHHISQPATVLRARLYFLKSQASTEHEKNEIEKCSLAVDAIAGILEKLSRVSAYRTVPYQTFPVDEDVNAGNEILDIENDTDLAKQASGA